MSVNRAIKADKVVTKSQDDRWFKFELKLDVSKNKPAEETLVTTELSESNDAKEPSKG